MDNPKRCGKAWTPKETNYIKENFALLGPELVAAHLDRSVFAVQQQASKMGVSKKYKQPRNEISFKRPPANYSNPQREDLLRRIESYKV